jgi:hypothetical protein
MPGTQAAAALIALLLFGNYASRVAVRGIVAQGDGISQVSAPSAGEVREVHVREGERVARSAPLVTVSLTQGRDGGGGAQKAGCIAKASYAMPRDSSVLPLLPVQLCHIIPLAPGCPPLPKSLHMWSELGSQAPGMRYLRVLPLDRGRRQRWSGSITSNATTITMPLIALSM